MLHVHIFEEKEVLYFTSICLLASGQYVQIDKASVLGEAINFVKQLQGRTAVLEQESKKKSTKSHLIPEVEAIGLELERELLIRILCEKRKGILLKLLTLLGNKHLAIVSSSVLPFGKNALNITIIAQMGEEYNTTGDELVKSLTQDL
ncbi:Transcription factor bHLH25 [Spatholobus suberectus]|nr:Transcription factor bHLH25 [Spatholobus suberectus]